MKKNIIAANWKMHKSIKEAVEYAKEFKAIYEEKDLEVVICSPYLQLDTLVKAFEGTNIKVGAQSVHFAKEGAYTGEISVPMLKEVGVSYCIVGHSERRKYFGLTDYDINLNLKSLFEDSSITPILCVGENLLEREDEIQEKIIANQLESDLDGIDEKYIERLVIAYEPVWAIGTGRSATPEEIEIMCQYIREVIANLYGDEVSDKVRIQYGGSVKPDNIYSIMGMNGVDGALVGGASLEAKTFNELISNAVK